MSNSTPAARGSSHRSPRQAVRELGLTEGSQVTAVIKASEVILATDG